MNALFQQLQIVNRRPASFLSGESNAATENGLAHRGREYREDRSGSVIADVLEEIRQRR